MTLTKGVWTNFWPKTTLRRKILVLKNTVAPERGGIHRPCTVGMRLRSLCVPKRLHKFVARTNATVPPSPSLNFPKRKPQKQRKESETSARGAHTNTPKRKNTHGPPRTPPRRMHTQQQAHTDTHTRNDARSLPRRPHGLRTHAPPCTAAHTRRAMYRCARLRTHATPCNTNKQHAHKLR